MKKLIACALVVYGMIGSSEAFAQVFFFRQPSTPTTGRSPFSPYGSPYGAYGAGTPFVPGPFLYGQSTYIPPGGGPSPSAPGYSGIQPGITGRSTLPQQVDQGAASMTGHPTRFFSYSHYFFNQGGGGNVTSTGTSSTVGPLPFGLQYAGAPAGAAPQKPAKTSSATKR